MCTVECVRTPFFRVAEWRSGGRTHHILSVRSPVRGHPGSLRARLCEPHCCESLCSACPSSLLGDRFLGQEWLGHMPSFIFNFLRNRQTLFQSVCTSVHSCPVSGSEVCVLGHRVRCAVRSHREPCAAPALGTDLPPAGLLLGSVLIRAGPCDWPGPSCPAWTGLFIEKPNSPHPLACWLFIDQGRGERVPPPAPGSGASLKPHGTPLAPPGLHLTPAGLEPRGLPRAGLGAAAPARALQHQ